MNLTIAPEDLTAALHAAGMLPERYQVQYINFDKEAVNLTLSKKETVEEVLSRVEQECQEFHGMSVQDLISRSRPAPREIVIPIHEADGYAWDLKIYVKPIGGRMCASVGGAWLSANSIRRIAKQLEDIGA